MKIPLQFTMFLIFSPLRYIFNFVIAVFLSTQATAVSFNAMTVYNKTYEE